jgi:type VI secretion system protein ImpE
MTTPDISPASASPLLLSQLDSEHDLQEALRRLENDVRREPASVRHRWALAEMLCLSGDWTRALKQVQVCGQLAGKQDASWHARSQLMRGLIRAEIQRQEVFTGRAKPLAVIDSPRWMDDLAQAIALNATGDHAGADEVRRAALDAAPTRPVLCRFTEERQPDASKADAAVGTVERRCEWIGDSDTRLGPVCEFIVAGGYPLEFTVQSNVDLETNRIELHPARSPAP